MVAEVVGGQTGGEQGADSWDEGGDPQPEAALEAAAELVGRDGGPSELLPLYNLTETLFSIAVLSTDEALS